MTRASFLLSLMVSAAAAAQQSPPPLPLPGVAPALPLPSDKKPEAKKAEKKKTPPPLPALELPAAKPAEKSAQKALPLPTAPDKKQPQQMMPLPDFDKAPTAKPAVASDSTIPSNPPSNAPRAAPASRAPAASTAPAMAASVVQLGDLRLRPDPSQNLWNVRGFLGGELSSEQDYTDSNARTHLGVEGTRWFSGSFQARGQLDWRNSRQPYVPLHSAGAGQRVVQVDENRFDVYAGVGYDLGNRMVTNGRLEFVPMLGVQYVAIRNGAFPSDLVGPNVGGRVRFSLSPAVILHATLGYTFNLASSSTQNSALKSPKGDFNALAGLALPLAGGYQLELDYTGDVIGFENTYRVAHGAALAFGTSF